MSHDLTTLGIAAQNIAPNSPSLDSRPLFQAALQYAQSHTVKTITVDPGSYYLLTSQQSNAVLLLPGLSNMTVDLAGSTIYFNMTLINSGLFVYFCNNFTLTNFKTDYINPPYTHVQITSVDTTNRLIHYQTLAGWPDPSTFNSLTDPFGGTVQYYAALFRNGKPIFGTTRTAITPPMGNGTLTLTQDNTPWTQSPTLATLQAGDTVAVTARAGGPPVEVWHGDAVTLSNITIYGSNGFAVQLYEIGDSVVDHVSVMPRPGTGLVGSNADGIHISSTYQNNHIRHCYVTRTMDDGIIMDTQIQATVTGTSGTRQVTVSRYAYDNFPNGTMMNFVDPVTTLEFPGGIIVSQTPPDSNNVGYGETVVLNFDRDLPPLTPGQFMVYGTPALRGQGSTFEDNTVEDIIAGRGIWVTGLITATVQRNVVRRTSEGGIVLRQDTKAFPSPPVQNITITDNVLENTPGNQAAGTGVQDTLGSIEVISTNSPNFAFSTNSANSNVTVVNNYIADGDRSGIWVGELNGGTIQNNTILRSSQQPTLGGTFGIPGTFVNQVTQDALQPLVMHYDSNININNNTIAANSSITAPVTFVPSAATVPATAGGSSFTVQTVVPSMAWAPISDAAWLTVTSPATGAGNGTVQYSIAPNQTGDPRTGHIVVAGETFTVTQTTLTMAVLSVASSHAEPFVQGQTGAAYTVTVSNQAGAAVTSGAVTVVENIPAGLTLVSMAGTGWVCAGTTCTRSDALGGGSTYPAIAVVVNVAGNAASPLVNSVSVSGGGSVTAGATDPTTIASPTTPVITPGTGVFSAASFVPGIAANSWFGISGTNLSTVTDTWSNTIVNGVLPSSLDGVSVSVGGLPAYIYYVSPTQINALAPNVAAGPVTVTVTTPNGTSAQVSAQAQTLQPAFFQWGSYAVATRPDYSLAVKSGTFQGVSTTPARPGDVIVLWGTGFGPTSPAAPSGQVTPSNVVYSVSGVTVKVGGVAATVYGAALTPGTAGLYQIAIQIPSSLANGDYATVATIGGVSSPLSTLITVQN
jgi:uncharacterized protein (TIGR03437 family)